MILHQNVGQPHPKDPSTTNPQVEDVDPVRRAERERQLAACLAVNELKKLEKEKTQTNNKDKFDVKAEFAELIKTRSGSIYMPPARLRALQAAVSQDTRELMRSCYPVSKLLNFFPPENLRHAYQRTVH